MTKFKKPLIHRRYPKDQLNRVYRFIEKYREKNGVPPSRQEIADQFNASKTVVIKSWFPRMIEAGMIETGSGMARSIKLLPLAEESKEPVAA